MTECGVQVQGLDLQQSAPTHTHNETTRTACIVLTGQMTRKRFRGELSKVLNNSTCGMRVMNYVSYRYSTLDTGIS